VNTLSSYDLELKAADQRRQLHTSLGELRSALYHTLDPKETSENILVSHVPQQPLLGSASATRSQEFSPRT
jgi:hypothetical protein